jgi:hypothetical protein
VFILFIASCEKDLVGNANNSNSNVNTLEDSDLGSPDSWGHIDDYFNLEDNIDVKFHLYDASNYTLPPSFNPDNLDVMTLKSFDTFEVVKSDAAALAPYLVQDTTLWAPLDSQSDSSLYSTTTLDSSKEVTSTPFKNVEKLVFNEANTFDHHLQYYTRKLSETIRDTTTVNYSDLSEFYEIYVAVDTSLDGAQLLSGGEAFMDSTIWEENLTSYYGEDETETVIFSLSGTRLKAEEIMARVNTDCNDNNQWDPPETIDDTPCNADNECSAGYKCSTGGEGNPLGDSDGFCYIDRGNGLFDKEEPSLSSVGELIYQDRNCSGGDYPNDAELTSAGTDSDSCINLLRGEWLTDDEGLSFCDVGNGRYDFAETYTVNGDTSSVDPSSPLSIAALAGVGITADYLYTVSNSRPSLLVDFPQGYSNPPVVMHTIKPGDGMTTRWGTTHVDIIEEFTVQDIVEYTYKDLLKTERVYSHPIIQYFEAEASSPYSVLKTEWNKNGYKYDYHMFRKEESGDIVKLTYPEYFYPQVTKNFGSGVYAASSLADNFWIDSVFVNDTVFYTYNDGFLRDGEYYEKETVKSIALPGELLANFLIEETYEVEKLELSSLPILPIISGDDTVSTIDCFKIKRTKEMTMLGVDVKYFVDNTTWLGRANGNALGIVKTELEYRWHAFDMTGVSRLELLENNSVPLERNANFYNSVTKISVDEIEEMGEDPYSYSRTGVLQRIGE